MKNDEVWEAFLPLIRKTFIQCGAAVAGLAVAILCAIAFHGEIAWIAMKIVEFITGPLGGFAIWILKLIGNLPYFVYGIFLSGYVWISCVWWKLKSVASIKPFAQKLKLWMAILGLVNSGMLLMAIFTQTEYGELHLLMLFFALFAKVCFVDMMPYDGTSYQCKED